jgi:tyrosyl-tRNA synthetase
MPNFLITLSEIKNLMKEYRDKIVLPIDFVIEEDKILDLNTKSIKKYISYFEKSKTIFINGRDFYINNKLKQNIWWSADEMNTFRMLFSDEIKKINALYPKLSYKELVNKLFNNYT